MKIGCCIDISHYDRLVQLGYDSITLAAKDVAAWDSETFLRNSQILSAGPLACISLNSFCTPALRHIVALEQRVRHRGNPHECRHR